MTKREVEEYIMSQIFPNASHEVTAQNVRNAFAPIVERVWTFLEGEIGDLTQLQTADKQSVVNAINAVLTKMKTDIDKVNADIAELGSKVGEFQNTLRINEQKDGLYITDANGNIIAKINKDGLSTTAVKLLKDGRLNDVLSLLENKVDKESGKSLSTNDYTTADKNKVATIANKVDKEEGKGLSTNDLTDELKEKIENAKSLNSISENENTCFYVVDNNGNIVAKINDQGCTSVDFILPDGTKLSDMKDRGVEGIKSTYIDKFYITDSSGYVIAKIDSNGITSIDLLVKDEEEIVSARELIDRRRKPLFGQTISVVGDSMSARSWDINSPDRGWMPMFCELSGAVASSMYSKSQGGTKTIQGDNLSGQMRLREVIAKTTPSLIFYQNINDVTNTSTQIGNIEDESFMTSSINNLNITAQNDLSSAISYTNNNLSTIVANVPASNKKHGAIVGVPYNAAGVKVIVSGSVTKEGNVSFVVGNNSKSIHVLTTDTITDVINKILEYDWWMVADVPSDNNGVVFASTGSTPLTSVTINANSTGLVFSQSAVSDAVLYYHIGFMSHDVSAWTNPLSWKPINEISYYSAIKGVCEYVQTNCPNANLCILGFPQATYNYSNGKEKKRADGTFDISQIDLSQQNNRIDAQKEICKYYGVRFFDIAHNWGVSYYNAQSYYPEANVHCLPSGFDKIGETLFDLMF